MTTAVDIYSFGMCALEVRGAWFLPRNTGGLVAANDLPEWSHTQLQSLVSASF